MSVTRFAAGWALSDGMNDSGQIRYAAPHTMRNHSPLLGTGGPVQLDLGLDLAWRYIALLILIGDAVGD
jgi:hypothetical protein